MAILYIECISGISLVSLKQAFLPLCHPEALAEGSQEILRCAQNDTVSKIFLKLEENQIVPSDEEVQDLREIICILDVLNPETIFASPAPFILSATTSAFLITIVDHFGESPLQKIEKTGEAKGLRVLIGEGFAVCMIEATIDDMNPQLYEYVMERLFEAGAVDVTLQPIQMKKNRPAILLSCQSPWKKRDQLCDLILKETTTFGVRYYPVERKILTREIETMVTQFGEIRVKIGKDAQGNIIKKIPEYEDVKQLARTSGCSFLQVYSEFTVLKNDPQ